MIAVSNCRVGDSGGTNLKSQSETDYWRGSSGVIGALFHNKYWIYLENWTLRKQRTSKLTLAVLNRCKQMLLTSFHHIWNPGHLIVAIKRHFSRPVW